MKYWFNVLQQISRILEESRFEIESDASLSRACSLELKDHCGDIPKDSGQSMTCTVNIVSSTKTLYLQIIFEPRNGSPMARNVVVLVLLSDFQFPKARSLLNRS